MRLVMTTDTVGGVWTYTQELVKGLTGRGHEVVLVSFGRWPSEAQQRWAGRWMQHASPSLFRFVPTDYKLEWMPDGHASFEASCTFLSSLIDRESPDLVHSNQFGYGSLPARVPKVVVAHSDVVSWWHARHGFAPPRSAWMDRYREIVGHGLAGADAVVTPTVWMRDQVIAHYGVAAARCSAIANGRTVPGTSATAKKWQAATAGRLWDEGKNVGILLGLETEIPIYIAGDASEPGQKSAAVEMRVRRNVEFLGALDSPAISKLLDESALYIATSRYEPFGLAPLEAALAGCVLVLNDIPSLREVWGDAALYYKRDNAASLAVLLQQLAGDPSMVAAAAAAAGKRARERYSAQTMVSEYCDLYAALTGKRSGALQEREVHVA